MLIIDLYLDSGTGKRENQRFTKSDVFLRDQVTVLENYVEIEKLTKEFQTHQRVIESKLAEEGAGEGEMIEEIQNAVSKTYEFRLKLIKLHAKLIEKIFNHQFSVEEFIDGVGVDYQEVCESIYMKVLGGQSEDEKK